MQILNTNPHFFSSIRFPSVFDSTDFSGILIPVRHKLEEVMMRLNWGLKGLEKLPKHCKQFNSNIWQLYELYKDDEDQDYNAGKVHLHVFEWKKEQKRQNPTEKGRDGEFLENNHCQTTLLHPHIILHPSLKQLLSYAAV